MVIMITIAIIIMIYDYMSENRQLNLARVCSQQ